MLKLSQVVVKCLKTINRAPGFVHCSAFSTSLPISDTKTSETNQIEPVVEQSSRPGLSTRNNMVAAAFASLKSPDTGIDIRTPFTDGKISNAQNVNELLSISEGNGVSRRHALKVVSVLSQWTSSGKVKIADFEEDPRFLKLCRILTKGAKFNKSMGKSEDLSTILSVTADDEAAKLVGSITLPQMVMTTLAMKKRRSTHLLRALSFNISANLDQLDLKQSADLLFSMCTLNFIDENLLAKICNDIRQELQKDITKSSVIGSITTSLGLLKYKNPAILDVLSEWIWKNYSICRPQDVFSLFITLATLNYTPVNSEKLFKDVASQLTVSEAVKPIVWLNHVWSLVLLDQATHETISGVLEPGFLKKLEDSGNYPPSTILKLLNIDGAAEYLIENYKGSRLSFGRDLEITTGRSKEKNEMVEAVVDSLKNLIQSPNHLKTNINTGLGFYIDAKCLLDKKCNPLAVEKNNEVRNDVIRVAIMVQDYHDMTRGKIEPIGVNVFAYKVLEAQGHKVLTVPFTEFKAKDKLIYKVQYLESKLKEIVK